MPYSTYSRESAHSSESEQKVAACFLGEKSIRLEAVALMGLVWMRLFHREMEGRGQGLEFVLIEEEPLGSAFTGALDGWMLAGFGNERFVGAL